MNILVPTDFSEQSIKAINVAVLFAKKFSANIDIVHFMDDQYTFLKDTYSADYDPVLELVQKNLTKMERALDIAGVNYRTMCKQANLIDGIKAGIEPVEKYELIIMGAHGELANDQPYLGSNTLKVIRKVAAKVLVVKNQPSDINFKEVLFVTGLDSRDKLAFEKFIEFLKPFDSQKVHILTVDTPRYFSEPRFLMEEVLDEFELLAKNIQCETHFYPDYSIEAGVRHFMENNKIDLVAISNHVKHPLKRIFRGSNVEAIVSQSVVPVLTVDFPKVEQQ